MHDDTDTTDGGTDRRTFLRAAGGALLAGGAGLAAAGAAAQANGGDPAPPLVLNDFEGSNWPGQNALGNYADAGGFANGDGEVGGGALHLEYDRAGWLMSNVRRSLSSYSKLVIVASGRGGEEQDVQLEVGGVEGTLADLTDDAIGTEPAPVVVDLEGIGVDRSMVDAVGLTFFQGGTGTLVVDEIRFEAEGGGGQLPPVGDGNSLPNDPDDDGHYEDVDGSGELDFNDLVAYYQHKDEPAMTEHVGAYDYNDDGELDFNDLVALYQEGFR